MQQAVDRLIQGAIDLHCHGYPEIALDWKAPQDDVAWIQRARDLGIRGIVLKSHMWPTMERAYLLRQAVPGIEILGSITLNPCVGGLDPWIVEAAAKLGAKIVWMPTWGAQHDINWNGFSNIIRRVYSSPNLGCGLRIVTEDGQIKPEVKTIIEVVRDYDLILSSGHVSPHETIALAKETSRFGYKKLVFGHPHSRSVGATPEQMQQVASLGGWLEFCFIGTLPRLQRCNPQQFTDTIALVGAARCVLSTDVFYWWSPPEPELLRMYLATMLDLGVKEDDLKTMVQGNPAYLLEL